VNKLDFSGTIISVKARIKLIRSFDEIPTHQYQGYTLILEGIVGSERREYRLGVGPKAHEKFQFRIGDIIDGKTVSAEFPNLEWAEFYKVSALKIQKRGPESENRPADPEGGTAPPLKDYKHHGHLRLDKKTCHSKCLRCPFGLTMATAIIVDHWELSEKKWRFETHCYGPRDCPIYKPGRPYRVPGRKGMVYVDNDYERYQSGDY